MACHLQTAVAAWRAQQGPSRISEPHVKHYRKALLMIICSAVQLLENGPKGRFNAIHVLLKLCKWHPVSIDSTYALQGLTTWITTRQSHASLHVGPCVLNPLILVHTFYLNGTIQVPSCSGILMWSYSLSLVKVSTEFSILVLHMCPSLLCNFISPDIVDYRWLHMQMVFWFMDSRVCKALWAKHPSLWRSLPLWGHPWARLLNRRSATNHQNTR
jgi:hypothetical protein